MKVKPEQARHINVGGYPLRFTLHIAGKWGCNPCSGGHPIGEGERLWINNYGDHYCDPCAIECGTAVA